MSEISHGVRGQHFTSNLQPDQTITVSSDLIPPIALTVSTHATQITQILGWILTNTVLSSTCVHPRKSNVTQNPWVWAPMLGSPWRERID